MSELTPEEKKRIYEEEKERMKAQEKIKKKTKPATWGCLTIIIVIAIVWLGGVFSPSRKQVTSTKPAAQKQESIEYMLATIEKGYVSRDDPIIARFRSLLKQLDAKFVENKTQIADMSVGAQKLLKEDEGIKESLLNIMEGMNRLFSSESTKLKYPEYLSAYMILRSKGQSHYEAIAGLKALLQSLGIY